jgi:endonuclease I
MKRVAYLSVFFASHLALTAQIPSGYYDSAQGKSCAALKSALKFITTNGHIPQPDNLLLSQYRISDIKPREVGNGSPNVIWDVYSDDPTDPDPYNYDPDTQNCGSYNSEGDCFNKEHTVPKSWSNNDPVAEGDYHHVLPTDGWVNAKRSNYPFGTISGMAEFTSLNGSKVGNSGVMGISGKVFEPIDEFKGDLARCFFYFITRYQDEIDKSWGGNAQVFSQDTFPTVNINYLPLMLAWHHADPVSDKEIIRNEGGFDFQGNRNPFIDHPEFVDAVWNSNCPGLGVLPVNLVTFQGQQEVKTVLLRWQVASAEEIAYFELQKSDDGHRFTTIETIRNSGQLEYQKSEMLSNGNNFYRIILVDDEGKKLISNTLKFTFETTIHWQASPNPVRDNVHIQTNQLPNKRVTVSIGDAAGRLVGKDVKMTDADGSLTLDLTALHTGYYYLSFHYPGGVEHLTILVE